jgi:hypothetical protein
VATRPSYPLEALHGERARESRARTIDLAGAVAAANDAERRAAAADARATAAAAAVRDLTSAGARAGAIAIAERHAALMRRRAAAARAELARAQDVVAVARGSLGVARGRAKVVEAHRDRWRDDAARARDRREDD